MGFNCTEHKWQHLLEPCPICSYKYSSVDTASETNQNDTQDEAERMAESQAWEKYWYDYLKSDEAPTPIRRHFYAAFNLGYRAGVASRDEEINALRRAEANKSAALEEKCVHGTYNDTYVDELKLENERLQAVVTKQKDYVGGSAESAIALREQLAAEKQKALKLVEALNMYAHQEIGKWTDPVIAKQALRDYSTDSGDGEKG